LGIWKFDPVFFDQYFIQVGGGITLDGLRPCRKAREGQGKA